MALLAQGAVFFGQSFRPRCRLEPACIHTMAPKKLAGVLPTDAEIEAARALLSNATPGLRRSKMTCMRAFAKSNASDNQDCLEVTGVSRERFLEKYLVYQMRHGKQAGKQTTNKAVEHLDEKDNLKRWLCEHELRKEFGDTKAEAWIKSDKLEKRPDPITGSEADGMVEFAVTRETILHRDSDRVGSTISTEKDAADGDMGQLDEMALKLDSSKQRDGGESIIKDEPLTETEIAAAKKRDLDDQIRNLREEPRGTCDRLLTWMQDAKMALGAAKKDKYLKTIVEDIA